MPYSKPCQYSTKLIEKLKSLDVANPLDFALISKAICWAKKYHNGQMRKSGEPFYSHPLEVAYMIADYSLKTEVIVASILHDIVEDTEVTAGMLVDEFGWRISEMVDRLTRDRPDGSKWTVEDILNNAYQKGDIDVLLIKLIDRLHNMQSINVKSMEKMEKTSEETLKRFISLSMYLGEKIPGMLAIERRLAELCYQGLPALKQDSAQNQSMIFSNNFQLPSLSSQSIISQIHNPASQVA